jgi:hypothetical protein
MGHDVKEPWWKPYLKQKLLFPLHMFVMPQGLLGSTPWHNFFEMMSEVI